MIEVFRPAHPHRTRHPRHFSGQRKVSVPMCTTWRGPGSASAGWCFPGLNQKTSKAGRLTDPFRPACRQLKAEPAAALPPRSAPRSEHAARWECSVSETPRAAADGDAATPRPNCPGPSAARAKERAALRKMLRPAHPHRTRHPGHFSGQRKVSVLMRTTWRGPGSASAGWCFPGLNQKASEAGRRSGRFRPARRTMQAEPAAALSPRSAHRSEHAARRECSVSETPRAAADGDAATPRPNCPGPSAARAKERAALRKMLRPAHPHRTRHPGHFSGQRKVSVLMRTTWGGPGSASAGWCFPGLNQKASKAGRRSGRFCPAFRPVPAEPVAALPPRSAPWS